MTIASEVQRIKTNIANAYTSCNSKGATMPASQVSDNLATCISSIPTATEPTLASLTITPSITAQTLTPPSGTDGYNTINVSAVTSAIDSDIKASNIKSGVNILGVSGTVTELAGETRTVSITSTSGNAFTPSSGKNGITSIKCNPTNKALTITPTTTTQTFTVPTNYSGYGTVTCDAGTQPSGTYTITANGTYDVTDYASADVSVSGGGGGDIAIPHIKIIRATSWEVVNNDPGIDFNNIVTDNADNLPYLMFSPEDIEDVDSDWLLTGGFFLSASRNSFATAERFCPGISIGSFSSPWYGLTFTDYYGSSIGDGEGNITYWYGSPSAITGTIEIYVTWNAS